MKFIIIIFLILLILSIIYSQLFSKNFCNDFNEQILLEPDKITENTIWSYWDQGSKNISYFYKLCIKSWKQKNPNHNIIILDKNSIWKYLSKDDLPINFEKIIKVQHKSDFIRLALLSKYGGIWMDISTICIRPINSVFNQEKSLEGFAIRKFDNKNELSVFENWFITGKKGSKIIKKWKDDFLKICNDCINIEDVDKSYFEGVDFQKIEYGWYLTMHRIMMKFNQFDADMKNLYYNDSKIFGAEESAFLHYQTFGWNPDIAQELLKENDEFYKKVIQSGTPILKFTYGGGILKNINKLEENCVLKKLLDY